MSSDATITADVETVYERPSVEESETVLELDGVSKSYGSESVIDGLSLSVREGEILTLLGPSGCGKTTTLRLIAGLERPDGGDIRVNGERVSGSGSFVVPEQRGVGVVFQEFALFPHMNAAENVAFGLTDMDEEATQARVDEMLDLVGLQSHRDAHPDELSGGQQQRIALARSLAPEPKILLLDEPFSNLDVDLRVEMREEVRRILKEAGVTAVSVTHDQEEAMSISDRVAVMSEGHLEQVGRPEQVFQHPESRFVAGFLGHASFLSGYVHGDEVETGVGPVDRSMIHGLAGEYEGSRIDVLVRPDDIQARPLAPDEVPNGRVVYRRYLGPTILYRVELDNGDIVECMHNHTDQVDLDESVRVDLTADHDLAWFPATDEDGSFS
ncbi:ABC transporter ATP-binding protein [Haloarchaeobius iranensis]|uniref:Molybdate/tungstate import ATP-binding protein WtpC n=1 Tax=Haloarchaeobius iranensis TaxID=996166 RepID=A0A1G9TV97_9EURY|nr:ABC transporter ATP-binding protein [Haloarchaeobius iranensis]SDM51710.1 iron(III) transport system ATP-binding protein [Haloarchaeobius iranensis]